MFKSDSKLKLLLEKNYKLEKGNNSQQYPLLSNKYQNSKKNSLTTNINLANKLRIRPKRSIVRTSSAFLKRNYDDYLIKISGKNASINSSMIKVHQLNELLYKLKKYDNELNTYNKNKLEKINQLKDGVKQNEAKLKKLYDLQDIILPDEKISIQNFNEIKLSKDDIENQLHQLIQEKEKIEYNLKNEEEYFRTIEYMLENEQNRLFSIKRESHEIEEKLKNVEKYQKIVNDNLKLNSKKEENFNKLQENIINDINLADKVKEEQNFKSEKMQNVILIKENDVKELEEAIEQIKSYENHDMKKSKDELKYKVENAKEFEKKRISDEKKCIDIIFCLYIIQKYLYEEKNFDKNKVINSDEYQMLLQINNEENLGISQDIKKNRKEINKTFNDNRFKSQDDLLKNEKGQLNSLYSNTQNKNRNILSTTTLEETKLNSTSKNFYSNNNNLMYRTFKSNRNAKNNSFKKIANKTQLNLFKSSSYLNSFYSDDINNLNELISKFKSIKITKGEITNFISRLLSKLDFYVSQISLLHKKELNLEEKKSIYEKKVKNIISNNYFDFDELTKNNQKCKKFLEENNEFIHIMEENNKKIIMDKMLEKLNVKNDLDKLDENSTINNNYNENIDENESVIDEENIIFKLAKNIIMKMNNFLFICVDLLKDIIISKNMKKSTIYISDENIESYIKQNNLDLDKDNKIIQAFLKLADFQKNKDIDISTDYKLLLQYIKTLMKFCRENNNVLSKEDMDEINKNLIDKFYKEGNLQQKIDQIFMERFLAKNSPNFNNIFNHFFLLSDEVKENVILIYDLINSKENEIYLNENNINHFIQNNEINFENVSRKSLNQKKYTRMSISNINNDSQSFDAKSRAKRRYQELHSANTINIQKRDFDGFNKFKELCPDEQDNDSDETNSTKKIVIKRERKINSIDENIINKLYTPFLQKTKYLRKLNPNIPEIKKMTSNCSKAYHNIKKMIGEVDTIFYQMKIYNNPHINMNKLSNNTYNFLNKLIYDNTEKNVKKRAKSNRFRINFGEN